MQTSFLLSKSEYRSDKNSAHLLIRSLIFHGTNKLLLAETRISSLIKGIDRTFQTLLSPFNY